MPKDYDSLSLNPASVSWPYFYPVDKPIVLSLVAQSSRDLPDFQGLWTEAC